MEKEEKQRRFKTCTTLLRRQLPRQWPHLEGAGGGGVVGSMKMTGDRYTKTLEGRSAEGIISGWGILKGLLIGDTRNRFNNILRLSMLWKVHHQWP